MSEKFFKSTWSDICDSPFPLEWYRELFSKHHYTMDESALDFWNEYSNSQYWEASKWQDYCDAKVRDIVNYAYQNVPFYKELYDKHGVDISSIRNTDDLQKLPLVEKSELSMGLGGLASEEASVEDKLLIKTSGSTGARMSFTCDKEQLNRRWAAWMRLFEWTGWQWGNKEVRFWFKFASTVKNPKVEAFDAFLSNRHFFEFNLLDEEELNQFCSEIIRLQPFVVSGYWEPIEAIAKYAYRKNLKLPTSAIITSTQVVPDTARQIAEKVYGCPVYDKYASAEFSGMAHQCEQNGLYHIQSENVFLEVLKDGKRLESGIGESIVTDFSNRSTPLIRYRVGDVVEATKEKCICPKTLPTLKKPHGRLKNVIKVGDRIITELEIAEFEIQMWEKEVCDRVKLFQPSLESPISVEASKVQKSSELQRSLSDLLGTDCPEINEVENIEHFRGKRHRGESKLCNVFNN